MSTSWTEYRGQGFWCRDGILEVWLAILVDELDTQACLEESEPELWVSALREQWYDQVTVLYRGLVAASLDAVLTDDERRQTIVNIIRQLRDRMAMGHAKPQQGSVARMVGGAVFEREGATEQILRVADSFLWLLEGSLVARPDGHGLRWRVISDALLAGGGATMLSGG